MHRYYSASSSYSCESDDEDACIECKYTKAFCSDCELCRKCSRDNRYNCRNVCRTCFGPICEECCKFAFDSWDDICEFCGNCKKCSFKKLEYDRCGSCEWDPDIQRYNKIIALLSATIPRLGRKSPIRKMGRDILGLLKEFL